MKEVDIFIYDSQIAINNRYKDTLYINNYEALTFYGDTIIARYKGTDSTGRVHLYDYYYSVYKFLDADGNGTVNKDDLILLKHIHKYE